MNVVLWIAQGVLAALYLLAGLTKVGQSREKLLASGRMDWVEDFSGSTVRLIGAVEILGAIGVILPWATGIAPLLTPWAAVGLAALQIAAIAVHVRRKETRLLPFNAVVGLLAAFVAIGRFAS